MTSFKLLASCAKVTTYSLGIGLVSAGQRSNTMELTLWAGWRRSIRLGIWACSAGQLGEAVGHRDRKWLGQHTLQGPGC